MTNVAVGAVVVLSILGLLTNTCSVVVSTVVLSTLVDVVVDVS